MTSEPESLGHCTSNDFNRQKRRDSDNSDSKRGFKKQKKSYDGTDIRDNEDDSSASKKKQDENDDDGTDIRDNDDDSSANKKKKDDNDDEEEDEREEASVPASSDDDIAEVSSGDEREEAYVSASSDNDTAPDDSDKRFGKVLRRNSILVSEYDENNVEDEVELEFSSKKYFQEDKSYWIELVSTTISIPKSSLCGPGPYQYILLMYINRSCFNQAIKFAEVSSKFENAMHLIRSIYRRFYYTLPSGEVMMRTPIGTDGDDKTMNFITIAKDHAYIYAAKKLRPNECYENNIDGVHSFIWRTNPENKPKCIVQ